jgi:hypothetical protein
MTIASVGTPIDRNSWVSLRRGCRETGLNSYAFMKMVAAGRIRALAAPGVSTLYHLADIAGLAAEIAASRNGPAIPDPSPA